MDILKQCAAPIVAASLLNGFTIAYGISPDGPPYGLGSTEWTVCRL